MKKTVKLRIYHRVLAEIIVCSACNGVELHEIVKVTDLPLHPLLQYKFQNKSASLILLFHYTQ